MYNFSIHRVKKILVILFFLFLFLVSIGLMSHSFKGFGKEFAHHLIQTTSNPFVGLFVGILATSLIQSSSTTTSMVVAFVASGVLTIENAIPIIMGANIGTSVTNVIVSMGHITRKGEFRRALGGATVHDFFNLISVAILLPLELCFGFLQKIASFVANIFCNFGGVTLTSPVKLFTKPVINYIDRILTSTLNVPIKPASFVMFLLSIILLFISLYAIVKIMRAVFMNKADMVLDKAIDGRPIIAMLFGFIVTAVVQSSSITTSLLVPLIAAGVLSIENGFSITLGANVGTTVTALLASLAGNVSGITIAFVHLLFNLCGIAIIYPIKQIRRIPIKLAMGLAEKCSEKKIYAFMFVLGTFFVLPGILILIYRFL